MTCRPLRRGAAGAIVATLGLMVGAPAAGADPAGPTDYRSQVLEVSPPDDRVSVEIVGGDSFVQLTAQAGVEVVVLGYDDEPYLRISPDGTVEVNTVSPAYQLNRDRYGRDGDLAAADADAAPVWRQEGSASVALWHDHRVHWMVPSRAPAGDGGLVSNWQLPLLVDGDAVTVNGSLVLLDRPATGLWWGLAAAAAVSAVVLGARRTRTAVVPVMVIPIALALAVVLAGEWLSLPGAARPSIVPVLLSLGAATAALAAATRRWWAAPVAAGGSTALAVAGWLRVSALDRALVPGAVPDGITRATIALALGIGAGGFLAVMAQLLRPTPVRRKESVWTSPTGTASSAG